MRNVRFIFDKEKATSIMKTLIDQPHILRLVARLEIIELKDNP